MPPIVTRGTASEAPPCGVPRGHCAAGAVRSAGRQGCDRRDNTDLHDLGKPQERKAGAFRSAVPRHSETAPSSARKGLRSGFRPVDGQAGPQAGKARVNEQACLQIGKVRAVARISSDRHVPETGNHMRLGGCQHAFQISAHSPFAHSYGFHHFMGARRSQREEWNRT